MLLTDAQIEKALTNLNITKDLMECGAVAKNTKEAAQDGKNIQMIGEDNLPQIIMMLNDLKHYKAALRKIVCLNIPMPDEVFNIANDALEGVETNEL